MATYDSSVAVGNLSAAMKEPEVYKPIFKAAIQNSAAMQLARQLPNMSRGTRSMTVTNALAVAYWLATSTSLRQTSSATWKGKTLTAEEMAVIIPISKALLRDTEGTGYDIWGEITPQVGESMGGLIDSAVIHGTNLPSTWMTDTSGTSKGLVPGAAAASHTVTAGTGTDIYDDMFGTGGVLSLVEADGFEPSGIVAPVSAKGTFRQLRADRTATGAGLPIFQQNADGTMTLDGYRCVFPKNGSIDSTAMTALVGDWSQVVFAIRQDIEAEMLKEGVIQDGNGDIVLNLAQQGYVAVMFTFRLAFQISNAATRLNQTEATRYPFATLLPAGT